MAPGAAVCSVWRRITAIHVQVMSSSKVSPTDLSAAPSYFRLEKWCRGECLSSLSLFHDPGPNWVLLCAWKLSSKYGIPRLHFTEVGGKSWAILLSSQTNLMSGYLSILSWAHWGKCRIKMSRHVRNTIHISRLSVKGKYLLMKVDQWVLPFLIVLEQCFLCYSCAIYNLLIKGRSFKGYTQFFRP